MQLGMLCLYHTVDIDGLANLLHRFALGLLPKHWQLWLGVRQVLP